MGRHRRPTSTPVRAAAAAGVATTVVLLTPGTAGAHQHVLNPSGTCTANGGPGNADELTNPVGKTPGNRDNPRHAIDVSAGQDHCRSGR